MSFLEGMQAEVVAPLASNTLAYHLADEPTRAQLLALFQGIATAINDNAVTEDLREIIRKSPLSPATVTQLKSWLEANLTQLVAASQTSQLVELVYSIVSANLISSSFRQISNTDLLLPVLKQWMNGEPFSAMHSFLSANDVRYSGDGITVEDVVTMCESGFGYDLAMMVATMADLSESVSDEVGVALGFMQKQIKYGLSSPAAIAFYESGFADRVVAQVMATVTPTLSNRFAVPATLQHANAQMQQVLSRFPAYYTSVFEERRLNG
jgi:hypothetical protein